MVCVFKLKLNSNILLHSVCFTVWCWFRFVPTSRDFSVEDISENCDAGGMLYVSELMGPSFSVSLLLIFLSVSFYVTSENVC